MKPNEIFKLIQETSYNTSGKEVDWKIIVDEVDKVIRLIFQETTSKTDWITNFNFPVKIYKNQQHFFLVHRGYGKAWKSCNDEIVSAFLKAVEKFPDYKTQITGWSYGGGIAPFAAEDINFRTGKKIDEVMTFGAPRPLFGFFTKKHFKESAKKFIQYTFFYDFVTWLPFFYLRPNTKLMDKKNCWKVWRVFQTPKYHCAYGDEEYYC
ncbi:MAG: lipase family protein [Treponema sp.]|nr:lipase family protein [Treponema sp.]